MSKKKTKKPLPQGMKLLTKSILKNAKAIEGANSHKWWQALIIGFVSAVLPLFPLMKNVNSGRGDSFLNGYVYDFDHQLTDALISLNEDGYKFKLNENKELIAYNSEDVVINSDVIDHKTPLFQYKNENLNQYGLEVYYSSYEYIAPEGQDDGKSAKSLLEYITKRTYYVDSTNPVDFANVDNEKSQYLPSFIVLYKTGIYVAITSDSSASISAYTSFTADWKNSNFEELLTSLKTVNGISEADAVSYNSTYSTGVLDNFKLLMNEAYQTSKKTALKSSTFVYYGVYCILIFVMGLLLFLLTRGKRNLFNYLTFNQTCKIACWGAYGAAIIAMVAGFLFAKYASMFFIMFYGIRIMWMSMKQLKGVQ